MDQAFQPTHACTDVSGRVAGDGLLHPRVASGQDNHGSCCEGCGNGSRGGIRGCRVKNQSRTDTSSSGEQAGASAVAVCGRSSVYQEWLSAEESWSTA